MLWYESASGSARKSFVICFCGYGTLLARYLTSFPGAMAVLGVLAAEIVGFEFSWLWVSWRAVS
jgi:hypothetical protein